MTTEARLELCSVASRRAGEDLIGTAPRWDQAFAVSLPVRAWDAFRDVERWGPARKAAWERLGERTKAAGTGFGLLLYDAAAADPGDNGDGAARVTRYRRPTAHAPHLDRSEHEVGEEDVVEFIEACLNDEVAGGTRAPLGLDFHVCTHGRVDAACGKFGVTLHSALSGRFPHVRTWRTAHFGGHRFAPTMVELPAGRYWGRLTPDVAEAVARREGEPAELARHLRGWTGLDAWGQVVDREQFARKGWTWLDTPRRGETLRGDERGADVRLEFLRPDGTFGTVEATVEVSRVVRVPGSSHKPDLIDGRQFRVTTRELP